MPCQSLGQISHNLNHRDRAKDRFELTSNWCSHIVGCAVNDQVSKTIADDLEISFTTVKTILSQIESCYDNESLHWSSHSNVISDSLHCHLLHEVHINFKIWYRDFWLNLDFHEKTIFRFFLYHKLKKKSITNWLIKKKSVLTSEIAAKHLQFTKDHEHWDSCKWKIFFSNDKCSVEQDADKQ